MEDLDKQMKVSETSALDLSKREMETDWLRVEQGKHELETLKVFHAAALARWKDRRENEWKLNYAIWAGIAAFDGALLLHKDAVHAPWWGAALVAIAAVTFHAAYLWPTIERAIAEIEMQHEVELALRTLIKDRQVRDIIKPEHLGGAIHRFDKGGKVKKWLWKRYGLFAPLAITAALIGVAVVLMQRV